MAQGNPSWGRGYRDGLDDGKQKGRIEGVVTSAASFALIAGGAWVIRRVRHRGAATDAARDLGAPEPVMPPHQDSSSEPIALTLEARSLLQHVGQAAAPLAMSDHFVLLNPIPPDFSEDHPEHPAWTERQLALFAASAEIAEQDLVYVVTPADGEHPDLVDLTPAGLAVLLRLEGEGRGPYAA